MTITATIIADSISPSGIRLTTMQLRYPRFIHAEFMTHRMFSRNASSSRAIPVKKLIEDIRLDPAMPVFWGSNKPGMQAGAEVKDDVLEGCKTIWLNAMNKAIQSAEWLVNAGLHKQIANRILEPWAHINVVVTATSWENFFALRSHPDAQPEIKVLSDTMKQAMDGSVPSRIGMQQWHLPYITDDDIKAVERKIMGNMLWLCRPTKQINDMLIKVSVARCARVSYLTHDGRQTSVEEDIVLADKLIGATPLHASPAEHQATPDAKYQKFEEDRFVGDFWIHPEEHGNLEGWSQYRKTLPSEFVKG
jgi:hypothetical protein